jgi:hypothetical protein
MLIPNDIPPAMAIAIEWCPSFDEYHPLHLTCPACQPIANAITEALAAERERCAKVAESLIPSGFRGGKGPDIGVARDDHARTIAHAIRSSS